MYLHLGCGAVVPFREVLGVFDLDRVSAAPHTRGYLARLENAGEIHAVGRGLPVSMVVTDRGTFLSPVSPAALGRRLAEERWE